MDHYEKHDCHTQSDIRLDMKEKWIERYFNTFKFLPTNLLWWNFIAVMLSVVVSKAPPAWHGVCVCSMNVCVLVQDTHMTVLTKGTESSLQVPYSLVIFTETSYCLILFYLVPALKREKKTEEKSHTCFRYFRGYIMVCSFSSELSQCSRFFASFVFVRLIQVQEAQMWISYSALVFSSQTQNWSRPCSMYSLWQNYFIDDADDNDDQGLNRRLNPVSLFRSAIVAIHCKLPM